MSKLSKERANHVVATLTEDKNIELWESLVFGLSLVFG